MNRMTGVVVTVGVAFSTYAFGSSATNDRLEEPNSRAMQTDGEGPTSLQVRDLLAIERSQSGMPANAKTGSEVTACVEQNLPKIAPENPTWNASDVRWSTMRSVVERGCEEQQRHIKYDVAPALERAQRNALVNGYRKYLSNAEADSLIRFYKSDVGRRYVGFQKRLMPVIANGMHPLFDGKAGQHDATATPADEAVIEKRMELLRLTTIFASLVAFADNERRAGHDASGAPAIAIMMRATATTQGDALDELQREYSGDLGQFMAFVASHAGQDELRAIGEANSAASVLSAKYAATVNPEVNGDLTRWRGIYHSLQQNAPQAPSQ